MAHQRNDFQTIRSEGGLLPADLLGRALDPKKKLDGTRPEDYGLPPGERLTEAITQSWNRLRKHWAEFTSARAKLPEGEAGTGLTNEKWSLPLLRELGFGLLPTRAGPEIGGRTYAINRFLGPVPIHLVGCGLSLDRRAAGVRGAAAVNPHGLVQEFLNRSEVHLWAIVANGLRLRILRDSQALSRQSFLEFDLEPMFVGEVYPDFVVLWLMAHATRFAPREDERPATCWLEQWTDEAAEQGTRALGDLRAGVERALQVLGEGFTSHPKNAGLRDALRSGELSLADFHGQLLRVVYRLIFLFVAEDRPLDGQPLLHPRDSTDAASTARERFAAHYGTTRLRDMAGKIKGSRHSDLWWQFQLLVGALSGDSGFAAVRQHLALPALGSFLWSPATTTALNDAELTNHDLLEALRHLAFTRQDRVLRPVDYRNLGAEELGGVYESLLALTPQISADGARFTFAEFSRSERKTSGSYYTPDSLVQCLLDSALDPVVQEATRDRIGAEAEKAILALTICDSAVGSGHFLVGAAHRLARYLARVRAHTAGETEPSPLLYQQALRDVIGRCLYGVDVNPMAAELCRVSLWLEALEPGRPLSFLDHHIRVGNSLLGTMPELIAAGLPDAAFKPTQGDDKKACMLLKKRNKVEREGLGPLFAQQDAETQARLEQAAAQLEELPDDRPEDIRAKELAFLRREQTDEYRLKKQLADAWCAAFMIEKQFSEPGRNASVSGITQAHLNDLADGQALPGEIASDVERLSGQYQFFHWHLAFPEVFARGGFDCVLGNPPWVRQEEFRELKPLLRSYNSFQTTADLSVFFLELGTRITRKQGVIALLTPNKWFRTGYAQSLRNVLRAQCSVDLVIDFGHSRSLFPDADTFPAAIVARNSGSPASDSATFRFLSASDEMVVVGGVREAVRHSCVLVEHRNLRSDRWTLEDRQVSTLIDRIASKGIPLGEFVKAEPLWGIKSGLNAAFYVDQDEVTRLTKEDPSSSDIFRPLLRGRDIHRWRCGPAKLWHIVIESSNDKKWPWSGAPNDEEAEHCLAQTFPAIHCHLKRFEGRLRQRSDQGKYWWELRSCDYYDAFSQPKIAAQCIAYHSSFGLDEGGCLQNNSSVLIPTTDRFVLAVLNSRLAWWLMYKTFPHKKDEAIAIDVNLVAQFPVPDSTPEMMDRVRSEATDLLGLDDREAKTKEIHRAEWRLNKLIEDAYELADSDIAIISGSLPPRDPLEVVARAVREQPADR